MALGVSDPAGALDNFRKALQIFAELNGKDPNNADLRRQWAYCYLVQGRFQSEVDDLNGAIESDLQGVKIDEALVASSPTNASARNTLAQLYERLGSYHAKLAAKSGPSTEQQTKECQTAKEAYHKSLDLYQDMKNKRTLSPADASKLDEIAREIAKCNAALH